jgi:hypothetical protein
MQNISENQPSEEDLPSASHPTHLLQELQKEAIEISSEINIKVGLDDKLNPEAGIRRREAGIRRRVDKSSEPVSASILKNCDFPTRVPSGDFTRSKDFPRNLPLPTIPRVLNVIKYPEQSEAELKQPKQYEAQLIGLKNSFEQYQFKLEFFFSNISNAKIHYLKLKQLNKDDQDPNTAKQSSNINFDFEDADIFLEYVNGYLDAIARNISIIEINLNKLGRSKFSSLLDYPNDVIASIENLQQQINAIDSGYTSQNLKKRYEIIHNEIQLAINYQIKLATQIEPELEESSALFPMPQPVLPHDEQALIGITSHKVDIEYNQNRTKEQEIEEAEEMTGGEIEEAEEMTGGKIEEAEEMTGGKIEESKSKETKSFDDLFFNLLYNFNQLAILGGEPKKLIEKKPVRCLSSSLQCFGNKNLLEIKKKETSYFIFENKIYIFENSLADFAFNPANSNISQAPQILISKDELSSKITELEIFNSQNTLGNLANSKKLKSIDLTELTTIKQDQDIPKSILKQLEKYLEPNKTAIATATLTLREAGGSKKNQSRSLNS